MVTLFWVGAVFLGTSASHLIGSSQTSQARDEEQVRLTLPRGVWFPTLLLGAAAMIAAAISDLISILHEPRRTHLTPG